MKMQRSLIDEVEVVALWELMEWENKLKNKVMESGDLMHQVELHFLVEVEEVVKLEDDSQVEELVEVVVYWLVYVKYVMEEVVELGGQS